MGEKRGTKTTQCFFFFFWFLSFSSVISLFLSLFIFNNEVSTHTQFFNKNIMCILF